MIRRWQSLVPPAQQRSKLAVPRRPAEEGCIKKKEVVRKKKLENENSGRVALQIEAPPTISRAIENDPNHALPGTAQSRAIMSNKAIRRNQKQPGARTSCRWA